MHAGRGDAVQQNSITDKPQVYHSVVGVLPGNGSSYVGVRVRSNGSLHDVLHGKNCNVRRNPISLRARLNIAICSADALAYMHSQASQKILHGDVKSGNILLDDEFVPKVSDFGTSRLMSIEKDHTNWVIGDSSYIDPVYYMKTGLLMEKSDV
ncbi:Wall-associated receptor kinase 2 [Hordeum vulgare]|nr:Wall-associated receptor kinase 2 [Hordeum vulgare]